MVACGEEAVEPLEEDQRNVARQFKARTSESNYFCYTRPNVCYFFTTAAHTPASYGEAG